MARKTQELEKRVLEALVSSARGPLKAKELAQALSLPQQEYRGLKRLLQGMEKAGRVYRVKGHRYGVPTSMDLAVGLLSLTRRGDGFVRAESSAEDVFVPARDLAGAMDGDRVVVRIEGRPKARSPVGRTIKVLKRARTSVVGTLHQGGRFSHVTPLDRRLTRNVMIPQGGSVSAEDGDIVVVELLSFGDDGTAPVGEVREVLGKLSDPGVDILAIAHGYGLALEFPKEVMVAAEAAARDRLGTPGRHRVDRTDFSVFTVVRHLELRAADGALVRVLTSGEWMVDALSSVDEEGGAAYVLGTRDGATECHLYRVPLAGGDPVRLTPDDGAHLVAISPASDTFVDRHHSRERPVRCDLRNLSDGTLIRTLHDAHDDRVDDMALAPPELLTIENRDGVALDAALYRPPEGTGPWPLVVSVYGGPHAQRITNGWDMTVDLRAQALARRGYLVLVCDNRGAARRGLAFEGWIKHDMGNLEVLDQVDAVRWCVEQGLADPDRVAIYGWSYGGYMACMCLARAPDSFRAAVAGAPVTSWDGYDTCYTERYMGLPQENADGYRRADVMHHVEGIRGRLLLVHGLIDENVHFRHTARLIQSLIRARKPYELLLFPDERHMPRGEADRIYMEERIFAFLEEALA